MKWEANARGADEHGTPLVAVYGSEAMNAVDRANLVAAAPDLLAALEQVVELLAQARTVGQSSRAWTRLAEREGDLRMLIAQAQGHHP